MVHLLPYADPAPGFTSLVDDKLLLHRRLGIEVGRVKTMNKNPVAEKAVRELGDEMLGQEPYIRNRGLSAKELLIQRDQFNKQYQYLTMISKHRIDNHPHSERSKTPGMNVLRSIEVAVGAQVRVATFANLLDLSYAAHRIGSKDMSATRCQTTVTI